MVEVVRSAAPPGPGALLHHVERLVDPVGHEEGLGRVPAHDLLGQGDLVVAEGRAVGLAGPRLAGRRVADHRLDTDQRGTFVDLLRGVDRCLQSNQVVRVVHGLHVPAVGLEALVDVLPIETQRRRPVEGDVVVVVQVDDPAEPKLPGQRRGLRRDALHEVAVGDDRVDAVVHDFGAVALAQESLGHRHADAVGEALAQRAGRELNAGRDVGPVELGVPRRDRFPLTEALELLHGQVVASEVQGGVEQHRAVAGAEHESITIRPRRIVRIVAHDATKQDERSGRHRHRQAGVPGVRLLDRVHGQRSDRLYGELLNIGSQRHGSIACLW